MIQTHAIEQLFPVDSNQRIPPHQIAQSLLNYAREHGRLELIFRPGNGLWLLNPKDRRGLLVADEAVSGRMFRPTLAALAQMGNCPTEEKHSPYTGTRRINWEQAQLHLHFFNTSDRRELILTLHEVENNPTSDDSKLVGSSN